MLFFISSKIDQGMKAYSFYSGSLKEKQIQSHKHRCTAKRALYTREDAYLRGRAYHLVLRSQW